MNDELLKSLQTLVLAGLRCLVLKSMMMRIEKNRGFFYLQKKHTDLDRQPSGNILGWVRRHFGKLNIQKVSIKSWEDKKNTNILFSNIL